MGAPFPVLIPIEFVRKNFVAISNIPNIRNTRHMLGRRGLARCRPLPSNAGTRQVVVGPCHNPHISLEHPFWYASNMTRTLSKAEQKTVQVYADRAEVDFKSLLPTQRVFLIERPGHTSDAQCARALELQPDTVHGWKRKYPAFKAAYAMMEKAQERQVQAVTEFDRDAYIEEHLVDDALKRLAEIVSIQIDDLTDAATIAQVRQAATTILHDRGILVDSDMDPQRATVIIQQYIDEGKKYAPAWKGKVVELPPPNAG